MILNGSDIISEVLIEEGIDTVFGYPGGAVLGIYDSLRKYSDRIRHIITAHEQGASHAADGYARATSKVGVVIATSGPGATNLVTGIATAYMDSIPLVAITGNVATTLIGRDSFQEVYIAGITMPITKHNFVVRDVRELADTLRSAFRIASEGRPGPVLVDVPKDVSLAECEFSTKPCDVPNESGSPSCDKSRLQTIAREIDCAKRPLICFGGGARISHAGNAILDLSRKAGIPVCHTLMGTGVIRYDSPENIGLIGLHGSLAADKALEESDLIIAAGVRFSDRIVIRPGKFGGGDTRLIHIDIDKSELRKNVPVADGIVGDAREVISLLTPLVKPAEHSDWYSLIDTFKSADEDIRRRGNGFSPADIMEKIAETASEEAIYTTDVGQHQMWAAKYLHHVKPERFLTSGGLGTMGFGYGAAIGAKIAFPDRPVVHITGDGSFHMNMNEACTAVSYGLPVITVIINNSALGMVRQLQSVFCDGRYFSTELDRRTDYVRVCEGFGGKGFRCTNMSELCAAMSEALESRVPVWIECVIDRNERILPMIPPGKTADEAITE